MPPTSRSPASPPSSALSPPVAHDLKQRVILCLNKLADRDTLALASAELDSIAANLSHESFSTFLNCLHGTDSSSRSSVRKHCVTLLSLLSRSHGDSLAPHLPKMVSILLCRLHDSESTVRAACSVAAADISVHVSSRPFTAVVGPLIETLVQDKDANAQVSAAMCMAVAVEAVPEPETEQLKKALPKLGKLLRSEGFKAKPALIGAIGSVIGAGGAGNKAVLDSLIPQLTEFLSSDDWSARKSAAEALGKVAMVEGELAPLHKKACLTALDSRRFDKVKTVRDTMNRTIELWKDVPENCEEVSTSQSPIRTSSTDDGSIGCSPSVAKNSSAEIGFKTARQKNPVPTIKRSPSLPLNRSYVRTSGQKENQPSTILHSKLDDKGTYPQPSKLNSEDYGISNSQNRAAESGETESSRPDIKRKISTTTREEKVHENVGARCSPRVFPCNREGSSDAGGEKDGEDLCSIRKQLAQIENQQSNLLNLLQKFIGSSQSGIQSLESRVSGLEMALDGISHELAVSSGKVPRTSSSSSRDTCFKLPGTEFLSPKFWKKTENRFDCSKFSSSLNTACFSPANDAHTDTYKPESTDDYGGQRGNKSALVTGKFGAQIPACSRTRLST